MIVRSVSKAISVLNAFTLDRPEWALGELSRALDMPKPTVHHILATFEQDGWIERSRDSGKYRLGIRLWEKGWVAINHTPLRDLARPAAEELARQSQETVRLATLDPLDPGLTIYFDQVDGFNPVRAHTRIGDRAPSHCVATGKALLAANPDAVERLRARQLPRFTDRTITTHSQLDVELELTRKRGFAINQREYRDDIIGVAAPIRSHHAHTVAAIGISGPAYRLTEAAVAELSSAVTAAAAAISQRLGFGVQKA